MPSIETAELNQLAVLWARAGVDDYGEGTVSNREEIPCRWSLRTIKSVDALGNPVLYDGTVVVDREVAIDSLLWRGGEEKLPEDVDTATDLVLYQVKEYRETPDLKNRETRRTLTVQRYRGTLPTIE